MREGDWIVSDPEKIQIVDVKAQSAAGRVVDSLDAILGAPSVDSVVRIDSAALQLIDVKAHVLGGFA
jgi:hypothetical protein